MHRNSAAASRCRIQHADGPLGVEARQLNRSVRQTKADVEVDAFFELTFGCGDFGHEKPFTSDRFLPFRFSGCRQASNGMCRTPARSRPTRRDEAKLGGER